MKRYLILFITALYCYANGFAETTENTRPMWGVRAAFDINIPGKWHGDAGSVKMYRHGYGFTVGGVYNVFLGKGFYLEPGVSFFYDSYSFDSVSIVDVNGNLETTTKDPSLYKVGLRIPLVVGYSFNITDRFAMSVYTGPEFNWAFGGEIKIKHPDLAENGPMDLFGDFYRRVDCAWKIGIGFPYESFLISIDAAIGMTDLLKTGMSFRENRTSVALTYYF